MPAILFPCLFVSACLIPLFRYILHLLLFSHERVLGTTLVQYTSVTFHMSECWGPNSYTTQVTFHMSKCWGPNSYTTQVPLFTWASVGDHTRTLHKCHFSHAQVLGTKLVHYTSATFHMSKCWGPHSYTTQVPLFTWASVGDQTRTLHKCHFSIAVQKWSLIFRSVKTENIWKPSAAN